MFFQLLGSFREWRWRLARDSGDRVSPECLSQIRRCEDTRGVDLPTWRTPKEVAQMRRLERRAALSMRRVA